jgi:hypothetical protein
MGAVLANVREKISQLGVESTEGRDKIRAVETELNAQLYEHRLVVDSPESTASGELHKKAFYTIRDAPFLYDGHLFQVTIITTEGFVADVRHTNDSTIRGRNPCVRMVNQLDRVAANSPETLDALIVLDHQAQKAGKVGVVVYAHGIRYFDEQAADKSNPGWGVVVSWDTRRADGTYLYPEAARLNHGDASAPDFVDARRLLTEIQKDPKVGYIFMIPCNEAGIRITPEELAVPLVQYTTINAHPGESSSLEIVYPHSPTY